MATGEEIAQSLQAFCESYNSNERVKQMNRDWHRIVLIQPEDLTEAFTLSLVGEELSYRSGTADDPDLKVVAPSDVLADMFWGDLSPTGPYMDGTLKAFGSEEDLVRLDIIILLIWGG